MELKCEFCGSNLVKREGKHGSFYACKRYPDCTYTMNPTKIKHWEVVADAGDGETYGACDRCGEVGYLSEMKLCSYCQQQWDNS